MAKIGKWISCLFLIIIASCSALRPSIKTEGRATYAKNTIFIIVDGMGREYIKAARIYNGQRPFSYENFTCSTEVTTCSKEGLDSSGRCLGDDNGVTDSAAAATAMATGIKVNNGVISQEISEKPNDLETILELAKRLKKSTGIVSTKLFSDATPAAFVSHANHRDLTEEIVKDIFSETRPNVVFGADNEFHRKIARTSSTPYHMVHTAADLNALASVIALDGPCDNFTCPYVYGGFGEHDLIPHVFPGKSGLPLEITASSYFSEHDIPHLSQMTKSALTILSKNGSGFFLMVESSMPDVIGHNHFNIDEIGSSPRAIEALVKEMLEVDNTMKILDAFLAEHPDTLVVLTADHETGGLEVLEHETDCVGQHGCIPQVRWHAKRYDASPDSLAKHTGVNVPLYAKGLGAERFCRDRIDNTDIPRLVVTK